MLDFFKRLRRAKLTALVESRFRDPMIDFDISEDRVRTFDGPQATDVTNGAYLSEQDGYVSLHLAGERIASVQALMDRNAPARLMLSYTEIMAGFTRFIASPRTIAMLGLGGGSLAKHCYVRFPDSRILIAEVDPSVIALRHAFSIPGDDDRFHVLHKDGAALVRENEGAFDVLLIDAFDETGYPQHFATRDFYRSCLRALAADGVLVVNFSGADWRTWFERLDAVFGRRTVLYQCPDGENVIAFATKAALPDWIRFA